MDDINMAHKIEQSFSPDALCLINKAQQLVARQKGKIYLVGGVVRDLLLGKLSLDIDLVLEGDAIALAHKLADSEEVKINTHRPFLTANLKWHDLSLDLTTARSEGYVHPGALPTVKPGDLKDDLLRRDFTINAMAISLNPEDHGRLIDFYGGLADINNKLIRVLHNQSFTDDATRIWRAVRYEQRLSFHIEANTLRLLKRDIPMLDAISSDRIWYELECVFSEELPEKVFARADELSVLAKLHPRLRGNGWLAQRFAEARKISAPGKTLIGLYLALLTYNLSDGDLEELIAHLKLTKALAQTLRDSRLIKACLNELAKPDMIPSAIYHLLHDYAPQAAIANLIASDSTATRRNLQLYLDNLRYVKTILSGDDLKAMGIPQGPRIKEILSLLLDARLDGKVKTREDEVGWVREKIT